MPRELVRPPLDVVEAVVEKAVVPALRQTERELGRPLPLVVTLWTPVLQGPRIFVSTTGSAPTAAKVAGEMRLSFRETFVEGRMLFFGEAVVDEEAGGPTGFSGVDLRGEVTCDSTSIAVETTSRTLKHFVRRFRGW